MNRTLKGLLLILLAALIAGIGNAVIGFSAQKYQNSDSLFPAIDISLANTLGGIIFLSLASLMKIGKRPLNTESYNNFKFIDKKSLLSGVFKGANTCFFVFSTTYIVATKSLVLESTYILWAFIISAITISRKIRLLTSLFYTLLLLSGAFFITNQTNVNILSGNNTLGIIYGISAGITFALFLYYWTLVSHGLETYNQQIMSTRLLLIISFITISFCSAVIYYSIYHKVWIPFAHIMIYDLAAQSINGIFEMGLVYLIITKGMHILKNAEQGANFITAFGMSFAIPFTLLPEFIYGKFYPSSFQFLGIFLFMIGFILMSINIKDVST